MHSKYKDVIQIQFIWPKPLKMKTNGKNRDLE